jgi:tetratricopeptide (TPR) repeat protein
VSCFSLATILQLRALARTGAYRPETILKVLLGDGRRLFSNHFFVKADVTFHSGYYPSIFDRARAPKDTRHMTEAEEGHAEEDHEAPDGHEGHDNHAESEHEKQMDFLGPPRDWIEAFGRRFMITNHTHLEGGAERDMLPWLKISAELDPQRIETYTVSAFWLREMGRSKEAEQFLREGLRNNPDSYEILFELGRLYYHSHHDVTRARNVWEMALDKWARAEEGKKEPDLFKFEQIALNLERLEEQEGNTARAIQLLELAKKASPHPEALQKQIDDLRKK